MQGATTTSHSQVNYPLENKSFAQHIPNIQTSVQCNVPNLADYKVPKKNMATIMCNHVTAMPSMRNYTVSVEDINRETVAAVQQYNSTHSNEQLILNPSCPNKPFSPLFPHLGDETQFSTTRVMQWQTYCDFIFADGNKRPNISTYYRNIPSFNTSLLTYKDSVSEHNKVHLGNIFTQLYNTNNNINDNTLDVAVKIDVRTKLANLTNLYNFNGEYKAIDLATFYVELAETGLVRWNPHHLNLIDARPNVYGGALVSIEHQYKILLKIADEPYLVTLITPYLVHLPNWVSTTQYSNTFYVLPMCSESATGPVQSKEGEPASAPVSLQAAAEPYQWSLPPEPGVSPSPSYCPTPTPSSC
jgi:hypothetical protein